MLQTQVSTIQIGPKICFYELLNYIFNILRVLAHIYFQCVDESHGIEVICLYKQLFCIVQLFCCDCLFEQINGSAACVYNRYGHALCFNRNMSCILLSTQSDHLPLY